MLPKPANTKMILGARASLITEFRTSTKSKSVLGEGRFTVFVLGAKGDENPECPACQCTGNAGNAAANHGTAHGSRNKRRDQGTPLISAAMLFSCCYGGLHR